MASNRLMMRCTLVLLVIARIAIGCSCSAAAYAPLCQRIEHVKVLFIGTAIETNDNHDGYIKGGIWYRFSVEERFKGIDSTVREMIVDPASGSSCQQQFVIGERYLISSYGNTLVDQSAAAITVGGFPAAQGAPRPEGPVIVTGVCSGSRPAKQAAEDISFVRKYLAGGQPARVFGSVRVHADERLWNDRYPPLSGAIVKISGPGGTRTATTNQNGRYEIPDVLPGQYVLTAQSAGFTSKRSSYEVEVPACGCGVTNIGMFTEGSIAGAVLAQDGTPVKNAAVEYFHSDSEISDPWYRDRSTQTDERGRFRFSKVPPGDFLVGVHADSAPKASEGIPPTYWPGVTDIEKALVVRLAVNERRDNLVIKLGPRAGIRKVRIRVRWPDGRPAAAGANVYASVGQRTAESLKTDATGSVQFSLLNGIEYWFQARVWTSYRVVNGNKIGDDWIDAEGTLPASSTATDVTLILNKRRPRLEILE